MPEALRWVDPPEVRVANELREAVGGHPLVAVTLARRGFYDVDRATAFLNPDKYNPSPAKDLPNLDHAADRLEKAIRDRERICVWGDFDVDGQTSTALLVSALDDLGADVTYHIPLRETESHGIHVPVLAQVIDAGAEMILTCDTGVSAHEAIAYARDRGVEVIVTDHHDLPSDLPEAFALVNPKMLPADHPLHELPGVGCAYKLVEELYSRSGRAQDLHRYLDLVALGIVADLALQVGDVRYLLQRGMEALRATHRIGLHALLALAELQPAWLTEDDISYVLAPRMNALGRLADANAAVEFLTTEDTSRARILANELEGLNARRKLLCDQVAQAAQMQLENDTSLLDDPVLVLAHPTWPPGVVGIVASRLVDRYHRPAVLFSAPSGEPARGSARSIEGVDISAAIAAQRDMLLSYGGHPMAAGLSLEADRIPDLRRALSNTIRQEVGELDEPPPLHIDGYLPLADLTLDLVEDLERLAPFGPGNPSLTQATSGDIICSKQTIGRGDEHLLLTVEDEAGTQKPIVWWYGADWPLPEARFDVAYAVRARDFQGQREVQLVWVDSRPLEGEAISIEHRRPAIEVIDYRGTANPDELLKDLVGKEEVQIWIEGVEKYRTLGRDRNSLEASKALAIWTLPPGPVELRQALERVSPEVVYLFAEHPKLTRFQDFIKRVAGLIKYALRKEDGRVWISDLAAATAHREATVRKGISWLVARGDVMVLEDHGDEIVLSKGGTRSGDPGSIKVEIEALLEETASFRKFCQGAALEAFIKLPPG